MLWVRSTPGKLVEMILTSSDPRSLKRKSLEKDKLCEEGSRLARMDLEALVEAWTKDCIQMSEIIILLLSFLKIPFLMSRPSVWEQSSGHPTKQERERERERNLASHKGTFTCSFHPHLALSDPNRVLVFTLTLITLISWSRPHKKHMSMSHKGKSVFRKELKYWSCQCFDVVDKASRQLGFGGERAWGYENVKQQTALLTRDMD